MFYYLLYLWLIIEMYLLGQAVRIHWRLKDTFRSRSGMPTTLFKNCQYLNINFNRISLASWKINKHLKQCLLISKKERSLSCLLTNTTTEPIVMTQGKVKQEKNKICLWALVNSVLYESEKNRIPAWTDRILFRGKNVRVTYFIHYDITSFV